MLTRRPRRSPPPRNRPSPEAEEAPEADEGDADAAAIPLPASPSEVRASPIARKLAAERGVDLNTVEGTGPGGRILRSDVLAAEPMPVAAEEPEEEIVEAPAAIEEPSVPEEEAPEAVEEEPAAEEEELAEVMEEEPAMEAPEEVEESALPEPEPEADDMGLVPLTRMRQQIARTTVGSKTTIPHFYVTRPTST